MDENELENRLRRLGTEPVPGEVAARHQLLMSRRPLARRASRNHFTAVAAAMAIVIGGGVALAAIGDRSGPTQLEPVPAPTSDPSATIAPTSEPADPFPDDPCNGPPPFAGQTPEGDTEAERAANRAAESEAWEELKAQQCPAEQDEQPDQSAPANPFPDDPCKGPPPFAGQTPEGDTEAERAANRATESEAWQELKAQQCPAEQNEQPDQSAPTRPAPPEMVPRPSPEEPGPPEPMPGPPAPVPGPPWSVPGPSPEEPGPPDSEPGPPPNVPGPREDIRNG